MMLAAPKTKRIILAVFMINDICNKTVKKRSKYYSIILHVQYKIKIKFISTMIYITFAI